MDADSANFSRKANGPLSSGPASEAIERRNRGFFEGLWPKVTGFLLEVNCQTTR
jgi:hypothetical protein